MQIKRIGVFAVSLVFVFTSVAFSGEAARWQVDHSDLYVADPEYGNSNIKREQAAPEPKEGVRGYYGPDREERGISSEKSGRPLGFPLDRHPQLDVFVPEAGHPPYGPGA
jgi:hypothetical protein